MKNKKKILSLLACLSLLTSCNKSTPSSSSCKVTTSTPSVDPTPTPTPEKLNIFDYANTTTITSTDDLSIKGTLNLIGFNNQLTDEMKLTVEEITIPEEINGKKLTSLDTPSYGIFKGFNNLKRIKISKYIYNIYCHETLIYMSSPFVNLPSLESIEVDKDNEYYYTDGNCLILRNYDIKEDGNRTLNGSLSIVCGWDAVKIPENINTIRKQAFTLNTSIKSIKLHPNVNEIGEYSFRFNDQLLIKDFDLNGNTNFKIENNILYKDDYVYFASGELLTLPDTIVTLNLYGLNNITKVITNSNITNFSTYCFYKNDNIQSVYIAENVSEDGINKYTFQYAKNLNNIELSENNTSFSLEGNILYVESTKEILAAYNDVVIPLTFTELKSNAFSKFTSISSIRITKNISKIYNTSFNYINIDEDNNLNKDYDEYLKIYVDEDNPYFYMSDDQLSLIYSSDLTGIKTIYYTTPDKNGNINLPNDLTRLSFDLKFTCDNSLIKSLNLNEGLQAIETIPFNDSCNIKSIELPSTLRQIHASSGLTIFSHLSKLESISIKNEENEYFKMDGNCLINKKTNKFVSGVGDIIIPEYVTTLDTSSFAYLAISSITLHNKFTSIDASKPSGFNTFSNLSSTCKTIKYLGTLEEFKSSVGNNGSFYSILQKYRYLTLIVLDSNGDEVTYKMSDLNK